MPSFSKLGVMIAAALVLSACETPDRYPVSGEECTQEDGVKSVDSTTANCAPPAN
ncbi:MAG TPA: hypothetical protein VJ886_07685 [Roseovarius sp.]|nr:hypothetical protein [Roseovarius sp.]